MTTTQAAQATRAGGTKWKRLGDCSYTNGRFTIRRQTGRTIQGYAWILFDGEKAVSQINQLRHLQRKAEMIVAAEAVRS